MNRVFRPKGVQEWEEEEGKKKARSWRAQEKQPPMGG